MGGDFPGHKFLFTFVAKCFDPSPYIRDAPLKANKLMTRVTFREAAVEEWVRAPLQI